MELKLIKGGKNDNLINRYRFVKGEITDTRLMGVLGMHLQWVIPYDEAEETLHQFYYYDVEELGLDSLTSFMGDDDIAVEITLASNFGGLGAKMVSLNEREARWLANSFVKETIKKGQILPDAATSIRFITDSPVMLSRDERAALNAKICTKITTDYGLVNYYLMRLFGKDEEGAQLLADESSPAENFTKIAPKEHSSFLKNTIEKCEQSGEPGCYICESLIDIDSLAQHRIVTSEIHVKDGKVTGAKLLKSFRISDPEASMKLSRTEYVTVYDITDANGFEDGIAPLILGASRHEHECGEMYMEFKKDNSHVEQRVFSLSDDIQTLFFITDYGQLLAAAYSLEAIERAEFKLLSEKVGPYLFPTGRFQFHSPVVYDFAESGFGDFFEFLRALNTDEP